MCIDVVKPGKVRLTGHVDRVDDNTVNDRLDVHVTGVTNYNLTLGKLSIASEIRIWVDTTYSCSCGSKQLNEPYLWIRTIVMYVYLLIHKLFMHLCPNVGVFTMEKHIHWTLYVCFLSYIHVWMWMPAFSIKQEIIWNVNQIFTSLLSEIVRMLPQPYQELP